MSPLEDVARSTVTGLERGVTGTLGLPHALGQASDWLNQRGIDAAEAMTGRHLTPQQRQQAAQIAGLAQGASPFGMVNTHAPSTAGMDQQVQHVAGPYHAPQTTAGRYGERAGEFASGALMPGGLVAKAARVAIPAAFSQGAEDIAGATAPQYKPQAALAGALLGGGVEGFGEGIAAAPAVALARSAPRLTARQIAMATALREQATQAGIDITIPEAVQQVTGGATGMGRLQRTLETAHRTQPELAGYFANRPAQVRGAVTNFADGLSPNAGSPGMLGMDANRAAQGAQMDANSQRAALSHPYYQQADAQNVDPQGMADIIAAIRGGAAADKTGLISPKLQAMVDSLTDSSGQPITDQGNLSTARNYWKGQLELPPVNASSLDKQTAGIMADHLKSLDTLLKASPARQAGDAIYAGASRNIVDPLNAGPVGRIGATDELGAQTAALYPQNPPIGQPGDTSAALSALDAQKEGLAAALTHQHVMNTFNQSTRDLTSGPNQYGGALFARALMGNDEQANTLASGLNTIDPSGATNDRLSQLADVLRATGTRERPGSMTAANQQDEAALKALPSVARAVFSGLDPLEIGKHLSNATGGALMSRKLDMLSQMLRDPDTAGVLNGAQAASGPPWLRYFLPAASQGQQP